jgi:hypothetical protein
MSELSFQHNYSILGRPRIHILALALTILIEILQNFSVSDYLKLSHNHFLPHPFQFKIHVQSYQWMLYSLSY